MKLIVQKDRTGCGLASVATVAGVSYKQVKKVAGGLDIDVQDPQLWSDSKYVRTLLRHYGLSASSHTTPFTSWETLPSLALLAIKWHKRNSCAFWLWVIFGEGLKDQSFWIRNSLSKKMSVPILVE
ncbi:MAG: hypothetical protein OEY91_09060 [Nitrospirota bacterium]|nr:hypothetical protein [Nitrospirota bacterium]